MEPCSELGRLLMPRLGACRVRWGVDAAPMAAPAGGNPPSGQKGEQWKAAKNHGQQGKENGVRARSLSVSRAVPISHTDTSLARVRKAQQLRLEDRQDDLIRIDHAIQGCD